MIWTNPMPVALRRQPLHDYALEHARQFGDTPAFMAADGSAALTYPELIGAVEHGAGGLHAAGVGQGDVVALLAPNVPEYVAVFLAVSRLGAIVSTINPAYTAHEIGKQLTDNGAKVLVAHAAFIDTARDAAEQSAVEQIVVIGEAAGQLTWAALVAQGHPAPDVTIDADDVVCLPYSSGTTGLPKGVMLTHYSIVSNLIQLETLGPVMQPGDRVLGLLPFFHSYGLTVLMLGGVRCGATVVTLLRFELESFLRALEDHRISWAHLVPPLILAMAKHPLVDQFDLSALKYAFSGAAPLDAALSELFQQRFGIAMRQGYGMTEASPVTHYAPSDPQDIRLGTCGRPAPGTECKIVDVATGAELGAGEEGEVWVRGPQVMRGYWNNAEATAATIDEDGWLHTGDIGLCDDEGYLSVIDRVKELIKYKGFQVAPAELEGLLISHPQIADAAVVPLPDPEAGEVPKAFVVRAGEISAEEVKAFVAEKVASYKRLREVEFIEAIPKTASGKILRRELRG